MALWGGRFDEPTDADLRRLNDSIGYDRRFYAEDIAGSIAYAKAIAAAGMLTTEERDQIITGLEQVKSEFDENRFAFAPGDEDIHTAVERRLTELIGAVGGKLHTGRSRNDQVATDFRLWVMGAVDQLDDQLCALQTVLVAQAEDHIHTVMPGYTHFQPAQPITGAYWLLSFFWMVTRDRERLSDAKGRTSIMPLGSGALAGNPLNIDRETLKDNLGFTSYSQNGLDAVSDRDFVAEVLFTGTMIGLHLSRLAEDIITYSNPALGFVSLDDRYSTGSSLMPQKRNADPMELARGKSGRLLGNLTGLLSVLKGLPSGYNKDLQEDKEAIFDTVDTLNQLLPVVTAVIKTLKINSGAMRAALTEELLATDVADYLVAKGVPFREAHHIVGQMVKYADENQINLSDISLDDLQQISAHFAEDVYDVFDFERSVAQRSADGGTAPVAVQRQIDMAKALIH